MSTRLRGPPKPRSEGKPDPPDARTFATFAAMMLVIATVIIGIGGVLHGFPTFSEPVDPSQSADDAGNGSTDDTENALTASGEPSEPVFGDEPNASDGGG
ncbi:hypothetical protein [Halalkalicoccus jeotgali]|uniref:Uncharacterized protein n=1 Tax=Halalkalicoccus jeotgali (strain DSM 18796 / CECT 7217 / JCM 14584 / KCTC 4019 / B3) TaxID=795797 RepID=D8J2H2_HALJB|nr:hypothetical protein [Halalkalicoccus jeotgali]ADJ14929.1 hypothetical protein HacjB3_07720 [Halalkalicoccus jeotgali B3]ELY35055.1 hypothetical protein C497_15002 [Halalkalicoccus jeotgali B3]